MFVDHLNHFYFRSSAFIYVDMIKNAKRVALSTLFPAYHFQIDEYGTNKYIQMKYHIFVPRTGQPFRDDDP